MNVMVCICDVVLFIKYRMLIVLSWLTGYFLNDNNDNDDGRIKSMKKPHENDISCSGFSFRVIYIKDYPKVVNNGVTAAKQRQKHMLRQFQWNWLVFPILKST